MDYEYEYVRYKEKVRRQNEQLKKLREKIEQYEEMRRANDAMVCAVVKAAGQDVKVYQDDINAALRGEFDVLLHFDAEERSYVLQVMEENNAEEELRECECEVSVPGEAAADL